MKLTPNQLRALRAFALAAHELIAEGRGLSRVSDALRDYKQRQQQRQLQLQKYLSDIGFNAAAAQPEKHPQHAAAVKTLAELEDIAAGLADNAVEMDRLRERWAARAAFVAGREDLVDRILTRTNTTRAALGIAFPFNDPEHRLHGAEYRRDELEYRSPERGQ